MQFSCQKAARYFPLKTPMAQAAASPIRKTALRGQPRLMRMMKVRAENVIHMRAAGLFLAPGSGYNGFVKRVSVRRAVLIVIALLWLLPASARLPGRSLPGKWDIQIVVEAEGRYGLETRESRHDGSFKLRVHWLGLMERDDEDYLLLHKERSLEKWEAEERSTRGTDLALLKTDDFSEKPELRVNYVLSEKDSLFIDFSVIGFDIPRALSTEVFPLALPTAAGGRSWSIGQAYDPYVIKGSNRIAVPLASILKGPEVRKFLWTWRYRGWLPRSDQNLLVTQSHDAVVTVSITPHEE
jgi:hypothetical protein